MFALLRPIRIASTSAALAAMVVPLAFALVLPAAAHHPLGGTTPATFWHGFLSGIGHPVIGIDHLAFIAAAGIAAAFTTARYMAPAAFILATLAGCLIALAVGAGGYIEMLVAASVLLLGVLVLSGRHIATPAYLALFAVAGLCHGAAYAGAMVGAEPTPIAAYLAGLALVQYAIAAGVVWITVSVWRAASERTLEPQLIGAGVAGVGLTLMVEHIETLLFVVK